jgi:hypothetical protein
MPTLGQRTGRTSGLRLPRPRSGTTADAAAPTSEPAGAPAAAVAFVESVASDPDVRAVRWLRSMAYFSTTCGAAATATAVVLVAASGAHPNRLPFLLALATALIGLTGGGALAACAGLVKFLSGDRWRSDTARR